MARRRLVSSLADSGSSLRFQTTGDRPSDRELFRTRQISVGPTCLSNDKADPRILRAQSLRPSPRHLAQHSLRVPRSGSSRRRAVLRPDGMGRRTDPRRAILDPLDIAMAPTPRIDSSVPIRRIDVRVPSGRPPRKSWSMLSPIGAVIRSRNARVSPTFDVRRAGPVAGQPMATSPDSAASRTHRPPMPTHDVAVWVCDFGSRPKGSFTDRTTHACPGQPHRQAPLAVPPLWGVLIHCLDSGISTVGPFSSSTLRRTPHQCGSTTQPTMMRQPCRSKASRPTAERCTHTT